MAEYIRMSALSPTMNEGRIASWKIAEGASFSSGDVLCEVETDKASMDYEAPVSGTLLKILLPAGATAKVGDPIAIAGRKGEDIASLTAPERTSAETVLQGESAAPAPQAAEPGQSEPGTAFTEMHEWPVQPGPGTGRVSANEIAGASAAPVAPAGVPPSSPLARLRAKERGIDLRVVRGSGPNGRIIERDVLEWTPNTAAFARTALSGASESLQAKASSTLEAPSRMRSIIARRLSDSFFSAPHFYLKKKIRAQALLDLRAYANEGRAEKLSFNAFLIKIAAMALARHAEINVFWKPEGLERRSAIDIGLAVALEDGLITPTVRQCDRKTVSEIDRELKVLIEKAKNGTLAPEEYEGAGFTITNLGSWGIDEFTAIINPPASAILAVGAVVREPVADDTEHIAVASTITLTLGCDHRSVDGAMGAAFLADLAGLLEHPASALV